MTAIAAFLRKTPITRLKDYFTASGFDPDKADRQWGERTDPAKTRGRAVPRDAVEAVDEALGESGGNSGAVFMRARAANEVLKAKTSRLKLQRLEGELVDRRRAEWSCRALVPLL